MTLALLSRNNVGSEYQLLCYTRRVKHHTVRTTCVTAIKQTLAQINEVKEGNVGKTLIIKGHESGVASFGCQTDRTVMPASIYFPGYFSNYLITKEPQNYTWPKDTARILKASIPTLGIGNSSGKHVSIQRDPSMPFLYGVKFVRHISCIFMFCAHAHIFPFRPFESFDSVRLWPASCLKWTVDNDRVFSQVIPGF